MSGSLIRPFQPTVVRGFSKYTRMMSNIVPSTRPRESPQVLRVIPCRRHVMNRARPDYNEKPGILALQNVPDRGARAKHRVRGNRSEWQCTLDILRRGQHLARDDVDVVEAVWGRHIEVLTVHSSGNRRRSSAFAR